jgi:hypothetical protein
LLASWLAYRQTAGRACWGSQQQPQQQAALFPTLLKFITNSQQLTFKSITQTHTHPKKLKNQNRKDLVGTQAKVLAQK